MSNFQQLEVVGRGSETQLQMGKNFNQLTRSGLIVKSLIKNKFIK